ncbi:immunoglobulin-like domain-containing protein [Cystobacter fuscus]|uniref:immunoglobulin-like domain-containing protein n=1 Tax=Cystobacter fuscus TaxID=43 RepID=UPI0037BF9D89
MRGLPLLGLLSACGPTEATTPGGPVSSSQTQKPLGFGSLIQPWAETLVNTLPSSSAIDHAQVTVAAGQGIYLVVWMEEGDSPDILGVRVRASDGVQLDATPLRIGTSPSVEYLPSVAFDGTHFLVTWMDPIIGPRLRGARVRASDGVVLDSSPLVISPPDPFGLPHETPSVTFDGTNYLVAFSGYYWDSVAEEVKRQIMGVRIRPSNGTYIESGPIAIGDTTGVSSLHTASHGGGSLVVWAEKAGGVKAARLDAAGQVLDPVPLFISPAGADTVRVAAREGGFLVLWSEGNTLKARRVRASDGALPDPADIPVGSPVELPVPKDSWFKAPFDVTYDGQDYRVLWQTTDEYGRRRLMTTRVSPLGTLEPQAEDWLSGFHEDSPLDWVGIAAQAPSHFLVAYTQYDARGAHRNRTSFRLVTENSCTSDVSPPILTCPARVQLECTYGGMSDTDDVDFSDNCGLSDVGNLPRYYGSPGSFTGSVSAVDLSGNATACFTEWTVVDTLAPYLYLNGPRELTLPLHAPYQEQGARGEDTCDGGYAPWDSGWSRIQISGTVNSHVPGTYPITYSLTDLAGHTTTRTRTVTVLAQ